MKRLSLSEKSLWYLAAFAVVPLGGCAAMSEAFAPGPAGEPPVAQTTLQSIGAAVATFNPAIGAALVAASGAIGVAVGKKSAKKSKPATTPAV